MNTPEQILHDRVNLVRLVRRLDKSVNEFDWDSEKSTALWLRAEGLLQVSPFFFVTQPGHLMTGHRLGPLYLAIEVRKEVVEQRSVFQ